MPRDDQLELLDAHPRIGAPPGSVSAMSFVEQGYERDAATVEAEAERVRVAAELERLNAAYEARFGFRYVIFVAGRPRAAIVPLMEAALAGDVAAERDARIARCRPDRPRSCGQERADDGPYGGRVTTSNASRRVQG